MQKIILTNKEDASDKIENALERFPDQTLRIIIQSSSEYQLDTDRIRRFFMGAVLPEVTRILTGKTDRKSQEQTYIKLKSVLLPEEVAYRKVNGKTEEIKVVGSMSGKPVRDWSLFISAVKERVEQDTGTLISATQEGSAEYYTAREMYKDDKKYNKELDSKMKKLENAFGM